MQKLNIEKAINFPFSDKQWMKTVGMYTLGMFILLVIPKIVQSIFSLIGYTQLLSDSYASESAYYATNTIGSFAQLGVSILTLPLAWYLGGYAFKVLVNVTNKAKAIFPKHGDFWNYFKLGFRKLVVQSGPGLVLMVLLTPAIAIAIVFASSMVLEEGVRIFLIALLAGSSLLSLAYMFVLPLISSAMSYIFVKTDDIKKAYTITNIVEVIKYAWKEFYLLVGIGLILGFAIGVISIFTMCISWIATPILMSYANFVTTYFYGNVYAEIDKGITIK